MAFCPKCRRPFENKAGFCPFDGSELVDGAGAPVATVDDEPSQKLVAVSAVDDDTNSVVKLLADVAEKNSEPFANLIGKTLDGRYRIESILGEGGMGIVFLAQHVLIEKLVAVKILKKEAARNDSVSKRFVREAKAASRIGHPNIIDVTDFGTTKNGITYSVMEYVKGSTLAQVIRYEAALPVKRVLRICAQMAGALEAAHKKGVVHRDLKPDNVFLVDRDGRSDFVKIVDFGIARMLPIPGNSEVSRLTRVGTVFGTPEYMAPEQASGRNDTDHRVDIYALGTIMYEMLSGRVPHKGDSTVRTLAMQMLDPIPPLSSHPDVPAVPVEVENLVMKALEKKREDRWPDMATMMRAIRQILGEDPETGRASTAHIAVAPAVTTMLDGVETEVDAYPVGADEARTLEHMTMARTGVTAAPTSVFEVKAAAGEPVFVRRPRRPSIDDLDDEPEREPAPPRSLMWLGGLALLAAAAAIAAIFWLRGNKTAAQVALDAGTVVATDAIAVVVSADADAAVVALADDAGTPVIDPGRHAGSGRKPVVALKRLDAGVVGKGEPLEVEVVTRPEGGSLFIGDVFAGPDRTVVSRARGTTVRVRCSLKGHKPGSVKVTFKREGELFVCRMKPRTKCVAGIKNPFGKCP